MPISHGPETDKKEYKASFFFWYQLVFTSNQANAN
jgi:hypothetical protein